MKKYLTMNGGYDFITSCKVNIPRKLVSLPQKKYKLHNSNLGEIGIYVRKYVDADGYKYDEVYDYVRFEELGKAMVPSLIGQTFDWDFEYAYAIRTIPVETLSDNKEESNSHEKDWFESNAENGDHTFVKKEELDKLEKLYVFSWETIEEQTHFMGWIL